MARTLNEKITIAQEEIKQREAQLKNLLQQQKEANRKARTKRLIERGAILESLIPNAETLTNDQIKETLIQALCRPNPSVKPSSSAEPPSGANEDKTGVTAGTWG